jgi:peptide/nickel transport system ATP-binding protein
MTGPLIELDRVSRTYGTPAGTITAVSEVSLSLGESEAICIVGESGCGKTTTGRMLAGLLRPSSGRLLFEGTDVWEQKAKDLARFRRAVQFVHQDPYASLNPTRTIAQTLAPPLAKHKKLHGQVARAEVISLLERVGLTPPADFLLKYPHELSGGQRQRIGIAAALALQPSLIVADEPVSALDVSIQAQVLNLLMDLRRRFGLTYLFISHDLHVVLHMSDRVAVMYLGEIVEIGAREAIQREPKHPYTQVLLSAVPVADPTLRRERIVPKGEVASPLEVPEGCRFHPRCPMAFDRCRVERPAPRDVGVGHQASCHLY